MSGSTLGAARNGKDEELYAGTRTQNTTADQVHGCTIILLAPGIALPRWGKTARRVSGENWVECLRFCKL